MTSSPSSIPRREVCPWVLRRLFNQARLDEQVTRGALRVRPKDPPYSAPGGAGQLPGAVSELLEYSLSDGTVVALAHQYRNLDGSIGGSGHPDPKWYRTDTEN